MTTKFEFSGTIKKTVAKRGIVYAEVYVPLVPDTQNDFATADTIEQMAHQFMKSGRADCIDYEHDLKKTGSFALESFIGQPGTEFTPGAWVLGIKPDPVSKAKIEKGEIRGVSFYGTGVKVAVKKDGQTLNELRNVIPAAVSWTKTPANRTQSPVFVSKADIPAYVEKIMAQMDRISRDIEAIKASRLGKSSSSTPTDIRKAVLTEQAARNEAQLDDLRRQHVAKTAALESIWEGTVLPGESRIESERRLCRQLAEIEEEMAALGKSTRVDLDNPERSAFSFRGGRSETVSARLPSDSWALRNDRLAKSQDEKAEKVDLTKIYM